MNIIYSLAIYFRNKVLYFYDIFCFVFILKVFIYGIICT